MVRDAWLLSLALQDDLRVAHLLHWHKELESLVAHLQCGIVVCGVGGCSCDVI
jgi:hypothetical protein